MVLLKGSWENLVIAHPPPPHIYTDPDVQISRIRFLKSEFLVDEAKAVYKDTAQMRCISRFGRVIRMKRRGYAIEEEGGRCPHRGLYGIPDLFHWFSSRVALSLSLPV